MYPEHIIPGNWMYRQSKMFHCSLKQAKAALLPELASCDEEIRMLDGRIV